MGFFPVQIVCVACGVLGVIGVIVCCAVPGWVVVYAPGSDDKTEEVHYGLWKACPVFEGMQVCISYEDASALPLEMQAVRALTVISCMLSCLSLLILGVGGHVTTSLQNESTKLKIRLGAGVCLLLADLLLIIPLRWAPHLIVKINNDLIGSGEISMGAYIYVGWAAGALLLLGGGLLCCFGKKDIP